MQASDIHCMENAVFFLVSLGLLIVNGGIISGWLLTVANAGPTNMYLKNMFG